MTKTFQRKKLRVLVAGAFAALAGFAQPSYADITFLLDTSINGSPPSGAAPWMSATFADTAADEVTLTLTNLMGSGQYISSVVFNSEVDPTTFTVTRLDVAPPTVNNFFRHSAQDMDGAESIKGGLFNMHIDFAPPPGGPGNVFNSTNGAVIFKFVATGLDSTDFDMLSLPGGPGFNVLTDSVYRIAAKVQGIPGGLSGSIGEGGVPPTVIPEPETYAMLLAGLGLMGFMARRRQRSLRPS